MNLNSNRAMRQQQLEQSDETLDFGQLLAALWSGRWLMAGTVVLSTLLGGIYLIAATPIFEANGTVQVEQNGKSVGSSMGDLASLFGAPMETQAEIQILQSRMVLNKVIDNLNLLITAKPKYFPIFGAFIARHRNNDVLSEPLLNLKSFAWSSEKIEVSTFEIPEELYGKKFTLTSLGEGQYHLAAPDGTEILRGSVGSLSEKNSSSGKISLFVRYLRSNSGTNFLIIRNSRAEVLKALQEQLRVTEEGKQSGVISLAVEGISPEYVTQVIQQIEDAYVRQNVERRSAEAEQSLEFLQQQLPEIKARVDAAQSKLNIYQQQQGSVNVTKETELVLQQTVDFETKRLDLIGQRQQAIQKFTDRHPVVQALDAQIKSLESEQSQIKKRTESLPETQQEVLSLMRDLEVNTQIYTTLLNSAQELQVAKAGTVGNVRIIDYPLAPDKKSKPKGTLVIVASCFIGLILGVVSLAIKRATASGVDSPDEIERVIGLATYAAIPYTVTQKKVALALRRRQEGSHILADLEPDNVAIEALRSLRTSLQFALLEAKNNIIMFTGPSPGLGKSFISINLAAVLARGGKRVVVVDCDMRRGHLHKYIDAGNSPGLSDYIAGNADIRTIINKTSIEGLSLVTNGTLPPNPSELLLNDRFASFLESLSQSYDLVIVDTPPVLPVTDASIIGRLCGCVLLVLKEGSHPMRMIEETVRRLTQAGVAIRGIVFNQVGQSGTGYGYYYSSYGYTYQQKYSSAD